MSGAASLRETELTILNAPFEERGWERAVESIAKATRSSGAHLLGMGGPMLFPLNVITGNFAGYEHYFTNAALHGRCNWRVSTIAGPMTVQHEADYAAYRARHPTGDYDDSVSDLDIPFGCQSAMFVDRNGMIGLALLRSRRDGPCRTETLRDFTRLRHQLSRSIRVQMALDGEAAELMVGDTENLNGATILLDRHGALCALTPAAEAMLGEEGPLRLDGLTVRLCDSRDDRNFGRALARLLASDGHRDTTIHQARIGAGNCSAGWQMVAIRLPERRHGLGFEPHISVTLKRLHDAPLLQPAQERPR